MGLYKSLKNSRELLNRGMGNQYVQKQESGFTAFTIKGDSGTDGVSAGETVTFTGGSNITTAVTSNKVTISSDVSGDVVGPASATDEAMCVFDGTTGKLIGVGTIQDDGSIVTFTGGDVRAASLPDADPLVLGQLYTDGTIGPATPKHLMVSGGA